MPATTDDIRVEPPGTDDDHGGGEIRLIVWVGFPQLNALGKAHTRFGQGTTNETFETLLRWGLSLMRVYMDGGKVMFRRRRSWWFGYVDQVLPPHPTLADELDGLGQGLTLPDEEAAKLYDNPPEPPKPLPPSFAETHILCQFLVHKRVVAAAEAFAHRFGGKVTEAINDALWHGAAAERTRGFYHLADDGHFVPLSPLD